MYKKHLDFVKFKKQDVGLAKLIRQNEGTK